MLQLANRPEGRGFSTLSGCRNLAKHDPGNRPRKAMVCPTKRGRSPAARPGLASRLLYAASWISTDKRLPSAEKAASN
jgi:hypothetical protein